MSIKEIEITPTVDPEASETVVLTFADGRVLTVLSKFEALLEYNEIDLKTGMTRAPRKLKGADVAAFVHQHGLDEAGHTFEDEESGPTSPRPKAAHAKYDRVG